MMNRARVLFAVVVLGTVAVAEDLRIVKSGAEKVPLALGMENGSGAAGEDFLGTLERDLVRSGWFTIVGRAAGRVVVSGRVTAAGTALQAQCRAAGAGGQRYLDKSFTGTTARPYRTAHEAADAIVWAVKRERGIASTRIAMVGARGGGRDLYVCDADGRDVMRLTRDGVVCLSPAWGPEAGFLVYTSFVRGYPDVYRVDLPDLRRTSLAASPGLNVGASISPDGRRMVLTLSKDGNPELYVMDLKSRQVTRLTRTRFAAEASPSWSPDGKQIVYVSDRSGSPHLYVTGAGGGEDRRLTFHGSENVGPDWGPGGEIVYCSRRDRQYQVRVIDPATREDRPVPHGPGDHEDPSWAPDGRHIVCTRTVQYVPALYILDALGDPPVRLITLSGEWYSPAWSPR